jgi:hypothetical protein
VLTSDAEAGYDLCVSAGGRPNFVTRVNNRRDPRFVFIGASMSPPPSPLPFDIRFNIEIAELQSTRALQLSEATVVLRGNTDTNEEDSDDTEVVILNPDQLTFDPFCRGLSDGVQPQVRLTGDGEYGTARFDGSAYDLRQVSFTQPDVETLTDIRRFPDDGEIRLITRVEGEIENSRIIALMPDIQPANGSVGLSVEAELKIDDTTFNFLIPKEDIILTVE